MPGLSRHFLYTILMKVSCAKIRGPLPLNSSLKKSYNDLNLSFIFLIYGIISYVISILVYLYFIGFIGNIWINKTISSCSTANTTFAFAINLSLLILWGLQHSLMAREWVKKTAQTILPKSIERSTYILVSSITLFGLITFWQSNNHIIWKVEIILFQYVIYCIFALGWLLVFISSFLTGHFELFGLRQCWLYFKGRPYTQIAFTQKAFYQLIRHPIMLGILLAIWATPYMTLSHLTFSTGMTLYILVGIYFEEKDLANSIGQTYSVYQKSTKKLIPKIF